MSTPSRAALVLLLVGSGACKPEPVTLATPLKIVDVGCDEAYLRSLDAVVQMQGPEGLYFETHDLAGGEDQIFVSGPSREALKEYAATLPPPGAPAGSTLVYEDQNGRERQPWRMHCVEAEGLTISRVAELQRGRDGVKLVFAAADAAAFAAFTGERVGRPIAFVVGDEALSVPVVNDKILSGVTFTGPRAGELLQ